MTEDEYSVDDLPDVFGHVIFCDDIRDEVGGKRSFIGAYRGAMFIHDPFPVTIPKFAISLTLFQKRDKFEANAQILIFLPGDSENATIQIKAEEIAPGAALQDMEKRSYLPKPGPLIRLDGGFVLSPLTVKEPGDIKVRVKLASGYIARIGRLKIMPSKKAQERAATQTPQ